MIFFDIETIPNEKSIKSDAWARYLKKHPEKTNSHASLLPSFGQIISIVAIKSNDYGLDVSKFRIIDESEIKVLTDFYSWLNNYKNDTLCGHGIKGFDIPFLITRSIHNGILLPDILQINEKKPWEISHKDTGEIARFGGWNTVSLDALCLVLGVDTPKITIDGSKVWDAWKEERFIEILDYCDDDVEAVMQCYFLLKKTIKGL